MFQSSITSIQFQRSPQKRPAICQRFELSVGSFIGLALLLLFSGCGSDEISRSDLSGIVSYNGAPVPYGRIEFIPDAAQGNSGGPGFAEIVDGRYDTSDGNGRGLIPGPHRIVITGYSRKPDDDGTDEVAAANLPAVEQLFFKYPLTVAVPEDEDTFDIVVPSAAADTLIAANPKQRRRRVAEP